MLRRFLPLAAILVIGSSVTGCYSKATAYGGKFTFAYESMVEHENFVKPIAPGAKLEVHAFANGSDDRLKLKSAKSSQPDVVAVVAVKDESLVLVGKNPGVAEIELASTAPNGTELVDKMFFHVAKPTKHALKQSCTEESNAVYVAGDWVFVDHSLATAEGRSVIGFDYAPFKVEPRGALDLIAQPQAGGYYAFKAKGAKERITLRSTVDDSALTFRVVDRKDLSDASLFYAKRMIEGRGSYVVAMVSAGADTQLCSQNALTKAKSLTPEICKVTARLDEDPDQDDSNREQLARITALKFGVCKFELTLPELAKGKGVTLTGEVKVGREEYPGDQKSEKRENRDDEGARSLIVSTLSDVKDGIALGLIGLWLLRRRRGSR